MREGILAIMYVVMLCNIAYTYLRITTNRINELQKEITELQKEVRKIKGQFIWNDEVDKE